MSTYSAIIQDIPAHLRDFVVDQNYDRYTQQDHAVWRYIMRRNLSFLKEHAHPSYLEGLRKTGISTEYIPHIDEVNECLSKIGWKAVIVDGFLPPAVFMEFQYHKILVISADIRSIQHILYTPAPDIVHEAAGHAPIIADEAYGHFLQKFGEYGMKAFSSNLDMDIYEAIRHLSIIKEYPQTTEEEINSAEKDLEEKIARNTNPSEMTKLSRLHWWTVEYGLIGDIDNFKLYGAGLLSSVGESKNCLHPRVKKIPLTMECIEYNYDITKQQPQLFVNKDWQHLMSVLEEYTDTLAFRKGGSGGLEKAIESQAASTCEYSSGLQVSGIFEKFLKDEDGHPIFIKTTGPTSLSYEFKQLHEHGTDYHKDGFSSPVGNLSAISKPIELLTDTDLKQSGIEVNKECRLKFKSGIDLKGVLKNVVRKQNKIILMTFDKCTVKGPKGEELFNPAWGVFDMAAGASVPSVFFGTADKEKHNVYPAKSDKKAIAVTYSDKDKHLHKLFGEVRDMRKKNNSDIPRLKEIAEILKADYQQNWLIRLEILELLNDSSSDLKSAINQELSLLSNKSDEYKDIIESGLSLLN